MSDRFTGKVEHGVKMLIMVLWSVIMLGLFIVCVISTVNIKGDMNITFDMDNPFINIASLIVFAFVLMASAEIVKRLVPDNIVRLIGILLELL